MHTSIRNYFIKFNEPIEGRVTHMYLDVKGLVTIGVGNLIDVDTGSADKILAEVRRYPSCTTSASSMLASQRVPPTSRPNGSW